MVIEPRVVAAGFVKRWVAQACELLNRSFHLWFGFSVVLCLLTWGIAQIAGPVHIFLGFFSYYVSSEMAAHADQHPLRLADMPTILGRAGSEAYKEVWKKRWVLLSIAATAVLLTYVVISALKPDEPVAKVVIDYSDPMMWLFSAHSPLSDGAIALMLGATLQGRGGLLPAMSYSLRRTFGLSDEAVERLANQGGRKNPRAALFLDGGQTIVLLYAALCLPVAAPLLLALAPAITYVAFREMFIDDKGNRVPKPVQATSRTLQEGALG